MREIKFRAWDGFLKTMVITMVDEYISINNNGELNGCSILNTTVIMQYTGLKDKNGVEIYEGDIVRNIGWVGADKNLLIVQFTNSQWSFESDDYRVPAYNRCLDFKVIGNIYENPELLK